MLGPKKTCQHCHAAVPFELRQCECGRAFPSLTNELMGVLKSTLPSGFTDAELTCAFTETKAEVPRDLANAIVWATQQVLRQPFQGSLAQALATLATLTHSTVPTSASSAGSSSSSSISGTSATIDATTAAATAAVTAPTPAVENKVVPVEDMSEAIPPQKRAPPGPGALSLQVGNFIRLGLGWVGLSFVPSARAQLPCMLVIFNCVYEHM
jgi:hypothetical protein